jgi:molybdopterin-guanine dinucleotide biosynthesis protein MobB
MLEFPIPILGICAFSGTGKTTLLTRLLPLLRARAIRVAVVKHAHHSFEMDTPGKDSYELRKAGARQMLVASRNRMALLTEHLERRDEPILVEALALLDCATADLVLVEGFKHEPIPKIELHRPALGKPLLCRKDRDIVAVASDGAVELPPELPLLDLNAPEPIAEFIVNYCGLKTRPGNHESIARCQAASRH